MISACWRLERFSRVSHGHTKEISLDIIPEYTGVEENGR